MPCGGAECGDVGGDGEHVGGDGEHVGGDGEHVGGDGVVREWRLGRVARGEGRVLV